MATDEVPQRPLGSATIISRKRFLKQTAIANAVVSVSYLAGKKTVAFTKEGSNSSPCPYSPKLSMALAGPPRNHENGAAAKAIFTPVLRGKILGGSLPRPIEPP